MKDITFKNLTDEQIDAIKVLLGDACEIEEQKEEEKASSPKYGRKYYFIDGDCEVCQSIWYDDEVDRERLSLGNCFETREEAEFEVERLKVLHEMKKFAEPEDYVWDGINYHDYLYYDILRDTILIGSSRCSRYTGIYFKSTDDIRDCIEAVGEDRIIKYYFRIKEEDKE